MPPKLPIYCEDVEALAPYRLSLYRGGKVEPEQAFGQVLRELRKQKGLSQEQLALEADLQRNYVSLLERGLNSASLKTIFKLCPVLGVSASELIGRVETRSVRRVRG